MREVKAVDMVPTGLFVIYGRPKTYKTTTALAACARADFKPCAYIDADNGVRQRLAVLGLTPEQRKQCGVVEVIPPWAGPQLKEGLTILTPEPADYYGSLITWARNEAPKYKLVVVDTLTEIARNVLGESARTDFVSKGSGEKAKVTKRMALITGSAETVHPVESDYGFAQDRVLELIQTLDDAPCDVLIVSHEKVGQVKDSEINSYMVGGPKTVGNQQIPTIAAVADIVLRFVPKMQAPGNKPAITVRTTNHDNFFLAGDRMGVLPDGWELDAAALWDKFALLKRLAQAGKTPA